MDGPLTSPPPGLDILWDCIIESFGIYGSLLPVFSMPKGPLEEDEKELLPDDTADTKDKTDVAQHGSKFHRLVRILFSTVLFC